MTSDPYVWKFWAHSEVSFCWTRFIVGVTWGEFYGFRYFGLALGPFAYQWSVHAPVR